MQKWLYRILIFLAFGLIAFAINGGVMFAMMSEKPAWKITVSVISNLFFEFALAALCLAAANQIKPFGGSND